MYKKTEEAKADYNKKYSITRAENLKRLREDIANLSLTEFGKALNFTKSDISRLESGEKSLSLAHIQSYRQYFKENFNIDVSVDYLMGYTSIITNDNARTEKEYGLSDTAFDRISKYNTELKDMLDKLVSYKDGDLLKILLSNLWTYSHNRYDEYSLSNPDNGYLNKKLDSLDNQAVRDLLETEKYRDILKAVSKIYENEAELEAKNETITSD